MRTWIFYVDICKYYVMDPIEKRQIPVLAETFTEALAATKQIKLDLKAELEGTDRYVPRCHLGSAPMKEVQA